MKGLKLDIPAPATAQASAATALEESEAPILVAVDFSPCSEAALVWGCRFAEKIAAPLEVLHVVHDPADSPGTYKPDTDDPLEPMGEVAQRKLAAFLDRIGFAHPHLPRLETARPLCMPGLPASTILQVARDHGVQHLVLGCQRRSVVARFFHGQTAYQIVGHTPFPVTIVKADG